MPLFDFWRKRTNKKVEETTQPQSEPFQPSLVVSKPNPPMTTPTFSRRVDNSGRQLIEAWIRSGFDIPGADEWTILRRQRRFLEGHPELLNTKCDDILREMMAQEAAEADYVKLLHNRLRILQQVRAYGGTVEAIRTVYIDIFGGLTLDVPEWLEGAMQQHANQSVSEHVGLLLVCISRAENDHSIAAEVIGALYGLLGKAIRADERGSSRERLEEAVAAYQKALQSYAYGRYPEHYAELQTNLGNVHANLSEETDQQENLERAERCYKEALRVYTPQEFPSEWSNIKSNLGSALLMISSRRREEALQHFEDAAGVVGADTHPNLWGRIQFNLGACYLERLVEDRAKNLERATQCFNAALRHYSREAYPVQWAELQNYLGLAYLQRLEGDPATNIEKAIYCFQAVQRIPSEEITRKIAIVMLEGLGNAYRKRIRGDSAENIELAIEYLSAVLEILERTPFRAKWLKIHNDLGEAYRKRILGDRTENLRLARSFHRMVLMISRSLHPSECQRAQLNLAYLEPLRRVQAE